MEEIDKTLEKVRLTLELPKSVREQMNEVMKVTYAANVTEVIRRSIALYEFISNEQKKGGKLLIRNPDGSEAVVHIV